MNMYIPHVLVNSYVCVHMLARFISSSLLTHTHTHSMINDIISRNSNKVRLGTMISDYMHVTELLHG